MNEEDVVINVAKSCMDENHYIVRANLKSDKETSIDGVSYFDDGFLSRAFGLGRSFDEKLQWAVCDAIKDLKTNIARRELRKSNTKELNDKAKVFVEKCFNKGV